MFGFRSYRLGNPGRLPGWSWKRVEALALFSLAGGNIAPCPGYTQSGDYKCDHDSTHRVCAQLVKSSHDDTPLEWGSKSFWEITGQKSIEWNDDIVGQPNPGEYVYSLPIPRASSCLVALCLARGDLLRCLLTLQKADRSSLLPCTGALACHSQLLVHLHVGDCRAHRESGLPQRPLAVRVDRHRVRSQPVQRPGTEA